MALNEIPTNEAFRVRDVKRAMGWLCKGCEVRGLGVDTPTLATSHNLLS